MTQLDERTGFMCLIDYECELLEGAPEGSPVYASVADLKRDHTCWRGCGILEVRVVPVKQITKRRSRLC